MNYPERWEVIELEKIGEWHTGNTPRRSNSEYWDGSILWVSPKDMKTDRITSTEDKMTEKALSETNSEIIPERSIIMVTRSGILEHSLPIALNEEPVTINQDMKAFVPSDKVLPEYLYYNLVAHSNDILRECSKDGTTVASINSDSLYSYGVPIAPIEEQKQIVQKVKKLFSKLDVGVDGLEKAENQLNTYKRAILKTAIDGALTSEWRKKEQPEEPGSELENVSDEVSSRPELPESWYECPVDDAVEIIDYRGRTPPYSEDGIPHLRSSNVKEGELVWDDLKYVSEETYEEYMTRGIPQKGDVIFTTEGPLGNAALVPDTKFCLAQRLMVLRPLDVLIDEFLMYQILSPQFQSKLRKKATGTTVKGISQKNLRPLSLMIPPLDEQKEIVNKVEQLLSIQSDSIKNVKESKERASNLRKSILTQAFEGKLINPNMTSDSTTDIVEENMDDGKNSQQDKQLTLSEVKNNAQ